MTRRQRRRRIIAFARVFAGIALDFRRESKLTRRYGIRIARRRMSARHRRRAMQFREVAVEMGGVLIKLGQFFSSRADVMPQEYLEELVKLQDEVPPVAFADIRSVVESEFGSSLEEVFPWFDPEPLAAASLAQVHRARLTSGREVAVKVQRPGIIELCNIDLSTFHFLMDGLERFTRLGREMDLSGLAQEFERVLGEELDFYREGWYAKRFRENFEGNPSIHIPAVCWEHTGDRVLTLEEVDGVKISDYQGLEDADIDRTEVAQLLVQASLEQVLDHGFFHADPHPGNVFVRPGPVITYIDFGMTGAITPQQREQLKGALMGVARKDVPTLIAALSNLGFIRRGANLTAIRNALTWIFEQHQGLTTATVSYESLDAIQSDIRTIMYEHPFNLPVDYAYLARATATVLGVTTGLASNFDLVAAARPYVDRLSAEARQELPQIVWQEAKRVGSQLLALPQRVEDVLNRLQRGEIRVRVDSLELSRALARDTRSRTLQNYALWSLPLLVGPVLLYSLDLVNEAYGLAGGTLGLAAVGWLRSRRSSS